MSKIYYIYAAFSISFRFITIFLVKCYHTLLSGMGVSTAMSDSSSASYAAMMDSVRTRSPERSPSFLNSS